MTGFTLGNSTGAILGGESGGTLGAEPLVLNAPVQRSAATVGGVSRGGFTLGNAAGATLGGASGSTLGGEFHTELDITISNATATLTAPVQSSVVDHPTAGIALAITLASPVQESVVDNPTASVTATSTPTLSAPVQTVEVDHPMARIGFDTWLIAGTAAGEFRDEVAAFDRLTLTFRVSTPKLTSVFRPLKSDEGKVDVLTTDDGGYTAVDRANGGNTFEFVPPVKRQPLRRSTDYHVERYEEVVASEGVDAWDVEVSVTPTANRSDTPSISETAASGEWALQTHLGTIATSHVDAEALGTGQDGVERFELTMRLTFGQAHVWEAALAKLNGTRVRTIPDATNVAVDDTSGDELTVTVTPPTTGDEVPSGDYVVTEWESERLNDAYQQVTTTIADGG